MAEKLRLIFSKGSFFVDTRRSSLSYDFVRRLTSVSHITLHSTLSMTTIAGVVCYSDFWSFQTKSDNCIQFLGKRNLRNDSLTVKKRQGIAKILQLHLQITLIKFRVQCTVVTSQIGCVTQLQWHEVCPLSITYKQTCIHLKTTFIFIFCLIESKPLYVFGHY